MSTILLKKVDRPRDLPWYKAGAMLYGDWGTSKAYVLGIAFALTGHASWFFLGLMSILTTLVGICYMSVCRVYPDGGGVYSAVRHRSRSLAVVGALLLVADYVVTASLSALDAFHYFGCSNPAVWAVGAIAVVGLINWVGPAKASGTLAVVFGLLASVAAAILFLFTLPHLARVELAWPSGSLMHNWSGFVGIVLALSGVEAVANMTGIMKPPVHKTARKAIIPVILEVSVVTFLLGIAMNALPGLKDHTEDMLRVLGVYYVGDWYGVVISIVFGLLLLSAVNTAVSDLVNIQFAMSRDRELPDVFARLNRFGMPMLPLILATMAPIAVLLFQHDLVGLAALYAIGVVGAITLNLASTGTDFDLKLTRGERILLCSCAVLLGVIEITIAVQKHHALVFVLSVLAGGMGLRFAAKTVARAPLPEMLADMNVLTVAEAKEIAPLYRSSTLVGLKGINHFLMEEAAMRVKGKGENSIYVIYVEEAPGGRELPVELEPSRQSLELLAAAQREMETKGITAVPIWRVGADPGELMASAARELDVKTVMIGTTKRGALTRLVRGDVLRTLSRGLPQDCHLIISG